MSFLAHPVQRQQVLRLEPVTMALGEGN